MYVDINMYTDTTDLANYNRVSNCFENSLQWLHCNTGRAVYSSIYLQYNIAIICYCYQLCMYTRPVVLGIQLCLRNNCQYGEASQTIWTTQNHYYRTDKRVNPVDRAGLNPVRLAQKAD